VPIVRGMSDARMIQLVQAPGIDDANEIEADLWDCYWDLRLEDPDLDPDDLLADLWDAWEAYQGAP